MAFQDDLELADVQANMTVFKIGARLSIYVDCIFENAPRPIRELANTTQPSIKYEFRVTRTGKVTRKLAGSEIDGEQFKRLLQHFQVVYVPPIRDLNVNGLQPFQSLMKAALLRGKGAGNIRHITLTCPFRATSDK